MGVNCGGYTNYSIGTARGELTKLLGSHSVKTGVEARVHSARTSPAATRRATMQFRNNWVRQRDNTNNAGRPRARVGGVHARRAQLGHDRHQRQLLPHQWVLYRLRAGRLAREQPDHDQRRRALRVRRRVRRAYNRGDGRGFTFGEELPISAAAEAAYLRNPIAGLPSIDVAGGNTYSGPTARRERSTTASTRGCRAPGVVFKLDDKTVVRGGYGLFYDTNNVLNEGISQFGFSRGTSTVITNDNGLTFNGTNLTSPRAAPTSPRAGRSLPIRSRSAQTAPASTSRSATRSASWRGPAAAIDYVDRRLEARASTALARRRPAGARPTMVAEVAYLGSRRERHRR